MITERPKDVTEALQKGELLVGPTTTTTTKRVVMEEGEYDRKPEIVVRNEYASLIERQIKRH